MARYNRLRGNDEMTVAPLRWIRAHPGRVLGAALVASLIAHLFVAALPQPPIAEPEPLPMLSATITEMPPAVRR